MLEVIGLGVGLVGLVVSALYVPALVPLYVAWELDKRNSWQLIGALSVAISVLQVQYVILPVERRIGFHFLDALLAKFVDVDELD